MLINPGLFEINVDYSVDIEHIIKSKIDAYRNAPDSTKAAEALNFLSETCVEDLEYLLGEVERLKASKATAQPKTPQYLLDAYKLALVFTQPRDAVVFWDKSDGDEARKLRKAFKENLAKAKSDGTFVVG